VADEPKQRPAMKLPNAQTIVGAWPLLSAGVDWFVSIDDEPALAEMRDLASVGIVPGETRAAGLGGITEGATDPSSYRFIVGRSHESVGRVLTAVR
jgi:hypothetical protein